MGDLPHEAVDAKTVSNIELLAPGRSEQDCRTVSALMERPHDIFPLVTGSAARRALLERLKQEKRIIPSLRAFFENLKYLEPCAVAMKRLAGINTVRSRRSRKKRRKTIKRAFRERWSAVASASNDFESAYVKLWLFAMQNFPQLTNFSPRKEADLPKPKQGSCVPSVWCDFGKLAWDLGFRTDEIARTQSSRPDCEVAAESLIRAGLGSGPVNSEYADQIVNIFELARQTRGTHTTNLTQPMNSRRQEVSRKRRCGRPFEADYAQVQLELSAADLRSVSEIEGDISVLFVQQEFVRNFFDVLESNTSHEMPGDPTSNEDQPTVPTSQSLPTNGEEIVADDEQVSQVSETQAEQVHVETADAVLQSTSQPENGQW